MLSPCQSLCTIAVGVNSYERGLHLVHTNVHEQQCIALYDISHPFIYSLTNFKKVGNIVLRCSNKDTMTQIHDMASALC